MTFAQEATAPEMPPNSAGAARASRRSRGLGRPTERRAAASFLPALIAFALLLDARRLAAWAR